MVRDHVQTRPEYQAAVEQIQLTPLPAWIHSDVKTEVIRDAGLPVELSILDERLFDRLKQAFALHPWIARVEKVERSYPAHIQVDVVYRRPVAMVEVPGGLLPVDADAILLPTADFSPAEAENYLRIAGAASSPLGPLGTAWADPAIAAAAKLADLLQPAWTDLQLRRIRIRNLVATGGAQIMFLELGTRSGTTFVWGAAPGSELPQEATAAEKLARLQQLASRRDRSMPRRPTSAICAAARQPRSQKSQRRNSNNSYFGCIIRRRRSAIWRPDANFRPHHRHLGGGIHSDANDAGTDAHDRDFNLIADQYPLSQAAREYQHGSSLLE